MNKTIIAVAIASAALATSAFAGGYAAAPAKSATGAYVEANVGMSYHKDTLLSAGDKDTKWGWALGLDLGYQFNQYMSAELGGFYLKGATTDANASKGILKSSVSSWLGYVAAKLQAPLMGDKADVFMKAGLGLNHFRAKNIFAGAETQSFNGFAPVFAVGLQYNINDNMYVTGQYMHVGNSFNSPVNNIRMAGYDLFTLGLGYKFQM